MMELGLKDMIYQKHGKGICTYKRSKNTPIYCIFGSVSLQLNKVGYILFNKLCSDRR